MFRVFGMEMEMSIVQYSTVRTSNAYLLLLLLTHVSCGRTSTCIVQPNPSTFFG